MARAEIEVLLVWSPAPRQVEQRTLKLPAASTLADALRAAGVTAEAGVWGRVRDPSTPLRHGDRVELYRPLVVDPKEARRLRDQAQRHANEKRPAEAGRSAKRR
jgi:uncharacterized protein